MNQTKEQAFATAITDGINKFVRDVLIPKGFFKSEKVDDTGLREILELKYQIAQDLASRWANYTFGDPE